ncbi:MAG: AMP-binding protein, partial [Planctomycetia bacterium]
MGHGFEGEFESLARHAFFHLKSPAAQGWPPLPPRYAHPVWATYQELKRTERLPAEEIAAGQLAQAKLLLAHAIEHSVYYRELLPGFSVEDLRTMDDWRRLPILPRRTAGDRQAALHAAELPPGVAVVGEGHTSGTTGVPLAVPATNVGQLFWQACYLRDLEWCGVDPSGVLAGVRPLSAASTADDPVLAELGRSNDHWLPVLADLIDTGKSHGVDVRRDPRRVWEWLKYIDPTKLQGYPSALDAAAAVARDDRTAAAGRPLPRLKSIPCIAENLTDAVKRRLEETFGTPVYNLYSSVEAGYIASATAAGPELVVHAEHGLVEVVDAAGRPCPPGEIGRVLVTP